MNLCKRTLETTGIMSFEGVASRTFSCHFKGSIRICSLQITMNFSISVHIETLDHAGTDTTHVYFGH
jgi:hypothetical protein